jgi:hypothetical protein
MGAHLPRTCCLALAGFFLCFAATAQSQNPQSQNASPKDTKSQKKSKHAKSVETSVQNYYGGVFLAGDGGIPDGPCFRINGRVTSSGFFNELKSYDNDEGTIFRLGAAEVTNFPDKLLLSLRIRDQPCGFGLQPVGTGVYLTQETMHSMKLTLYWKHGVDLRPAEKVAIVNVSVDPIEPYATNLAAELPKRYLWSYEFGIPAEGVPLTDSLVLVFRTTDGHIVARVAARL